MFDALIEFVRKWYDTAQPIPLHAPTFTALDKEFVLDAIDSTFVSSVGRYVDRFEERLADYTGAKRAVAIVNGTAALQVALRLLGVETGDEVITQPLTFVATANAIAHQGAQPVFVDVDQDTMGLSPHALQSWLQANAEIKDNIPYNRQTSRRIAAIVPMHTFGHPCRIEELIKISQQWSIPVVEDAAEALGSWTGRKHCGTLAHAGVLSFNGNKTITCGGGGAILTNNKNLADRAKHLTTTAKVPHPWEFEHDEVGYNYRMPNLNAALACAQMERLDAILKEKRALAHAYQDFFQDQSWANFCKEPEGSRSNYWLCAVAMKNETLRDKFLQTTNKAGIMTRPAWKLMNELPMYCNCQSGLLKNAKLLRQHIVNLPSGVRSNG
jgi:aminotransferase in exopolysaccharide biosynthesis